MTIDILIKDTPDNEWNKRLLEHKFGTIHQTKEYAEFRRKFWGQQVHYITFLYKEKIIGQMILFEFSRIGRKISATFGNNLFQKINKFTKNFKKMYSWYYGSIIFDEQYNEEIYSEISNFPSKFNAPISGSLHPLEQSRKEFLSKGWKEIEKGTFLIDLTLTEEQLWENVDRRSAKKAVNRAIKKGITVKPIKNPKDVKIHHQLLNEGREIVNLPPIPLDRITAHWKMLSDVGEKGFIAWLGEKPLASTFVTTFNGYLNEQGFARSKYDMENLMNATDLIKWHIIEWGKKSGYRIFDLSGVELDSEDQKHQGIFKFKRKWGGKLQKWYHYKYS